MRLKILLLLSGLLFLVSLFTQSCQRVAVNNDFYGRFNYPLNYEIKLYDASQIYVRTLFIDT